MAHPPIRHGRLGDRLRVTGATPVPPPHPVQDFARVTRCSSYLIDLRIFVGVAKLAADRHPPREVAEL
jgi:hypothetical protein